MAILSYDDWKKRQQPSSVNNVDSGIRNNGIISYDEWKRTSSSATEPTRNEPTNDWLSNGLNDAKNVLSRAARYKVGQIAHAMNSTSRGLSHALGLDKPTTQSWLDDINELEGGVAEDWDASQYNTVLTPSAYRNEQEKIDKVNYLLGDEYDRLNYDINRSDTRYRNLDYMTDDEKRVVAYYAQNGDIDSANRYIEAKSRDLNERAMTRYQQGIQDTSDWFANNENGLIREVGGDIYDMSTALAGFYSSGLGTMATLEQVFDNAVTGNNDTVDPNSVYFRGVVANETSSENLMKDKTGIRKLATEIVQQSLQQYIPAMTMGGGAVNYIFGLSSAGQSARQNALEGNSALEGLIDSTVRGLISYESESKLSADELFGLDGKKKFTLTKEGVKLLVRNMLGEAYEEAEEAVLDSIWDNAFKGNRSEYAQKVNSYIDMGLTEGEAERQALTDLAKETVYSMIVAALSAGVDTVGSSAVDRTRVNMNLMNAANRRAVINEGTQFADQSSQAYTNAQALQQRLDNGGEVSRKEAYQQYKLNEAQTTAEYEQNIRDKYKELSPSETDISADEFDILDKALRGEELSKLELSGLDSTAKKVFEFYTGTDLTNIARGDSEKRILTTYRTDVRRGNAISGERDVNRMSALRNGDESTLPEQLRGKEWRNIRRDIRRDMDINGQKALRAMLSRNEEAYRDRDVKHPAVKMFQFYYQLGKLGATEASMVNGTISTADAYAAYSAGLNDRTNAISKISPTTRSSKAGLDREHSASVKGSSANARSAVDKIAKTFGVSVRFATEEEVRREGNITDEDEKTPKGFYSPKGYIVLRNDLSEEEAVQTVFVHEMLHRLKTTSPAEYAKLSSHIANELMKNRELWGKMRGYGNAYKSQKLDTIDLFEEIVADYVGEKVNLKTFTSLINGADTSVLAKIQREIKNLFASNEMGGETGSVLYGFQKMIDASLVASKIDKGEALTETDKEAAAEIAVDTVNNLKLSKEINATAPIERTPKLIAVHNIPDNKLTKAIKLGGFAMPSLAVVLAEQGHYQYGENSFIFPRWMIDPSKSKYAKIYGGDAWTQQINSMVEYKLDSIVVRDTTNRLQKLADSSVDDTQFGGYISNFFSEYGYGYRASEDIDDMVARAQNNYGFMARYLGEKGVKVEKQYREVKPDVRNYDGEILGYLANKFGNEWFNIFGRTAGYLNEEEKAERDRKIKDLTEDWEIFNEFDTDIRPGLKNLKIGSMGRAVYEYLHVKPTQQYDHYLTRDEVSRLVSENGGYEQFKKWVSEQFSEDLIEKAGIYNGKDPFTSIGNRRSFEALHDDLTLFNLVKALRKQQTSKGEALDEHVHRGSLIARTAKEYKNLDEVRADEKRLGRLSDKAYGGQVVDRISDQLDLIGDMLMDAFDNGEFTSYDFDEAINRIAVNGVFTNSEVKRQFKRKGITINDDVAKEVVRLMNMARNVPTGYFEAKIEDAVTFQDMAKAGVKALVPQGSKLKKQIEDFGLEVLEYTDEEDRVAKMNGEFASKLRFSKQVDTQKFVKDYVAKNKNKIRYSYAGIKGITAQGDAVRLANYRRALEYDSMGVSNEAIRKATGWFRGSDRQWRFEIDNSKAKILSVKGKKGKMFKVDVKDVNTNYLVNTLKNFPQITVDDVYNIYANDIGSPEKRSAYRAWLTLHNRTQAISEMFTYTAVRQGNATYLEDVFMDEELYAVYPELRKIVVTFDTPSRSNTLGAFAEDGHITLNQKVLSGRIDANRMKWVLLHEIQHWIQGHEEFESGSNPGSWQSRTAKKKGNTAVANNELFDRREAYNNELELNEQSGVDKQSNDLAKKFVQTRQAKVTDVFVGRAKVSLSSEAESIGEELKKIDPSLYTKAKNYIDALAKYEYAVRSGAKDQRLGDFELYQTVAGEQEARDVQARMNFTMDERMANSPKYRDATTIFNIGGKYEYLNNEYEGELADFMGKTISEVEGESSVEETTVETEPTNTYGEDEYGQISFGSDTSRTTEDETDPYEFGMDENGQIRFSRTVEEGEYSLPVIEADWAKIYNSKGMSYQRKIDKVIADNSQAFNQIVDSIESALKDNYAIRVDYGENGFDIIAPSTRTPLFEQRRKELENRKGKKAVQERERWERRARSPWQVSKFRMDRNGERIEPYGHDHMASGEEYARDIISSMIISGANGELYDQRVAEGRDPNYLKGQMLDFPSITSVEPRESIRFSRTVEPGEYDIPQYDARSIFEIAENERDAYLESENGIEQQRIASLQKALDENYAFQIDTGNGRYMVVHPFTKAQMYWEGRQAGREGVPAYQATRFDENGAVGDTPFNTAGDLEKLLRDYKNRTVTKAEPKNGGEIRYSLAVKAKEDVIRAVLNNRYGGYVKLTNETPWYIVSNGAKDYPLVGLGSHIRKNILTPYQANRQGLKVKNPDEWHGLGVKKYLEAVESLDDPEVVYRGTLKAEEGPVRNDKGRNYFLIVSKKKDSNGNPIIVPIDIKMNEKLQVYEGSIYGNYIKTVFGKDNLQKSIDKLIAQGYLTRVRVKKENSSSVKHLAEPISVRSDLTTDDSVASSEKTVNGKKVDSSKVQYSRSVDFTSPSGEKVTAYGAQNKLSSSSIENYARGLVNTYGTDMTIKDVSEHIGEFYERIRTAADGLDIWSEAKDIASEILDSSFHDMSEFKADYDNLKKDVKGTVINTQSITKDDIPSEYETVGEFVRKTRDVFSFSREGGLPVDVALMEISDRTGISTESTLETPLGLVINAVRGKLDLAKQNVPMFTGAEYTAELNVLTNDIIDNYYETPLAKKTGLDLWIDNMQKQQLKLKEQLEQAKEDIKNRKKQSKADAKNAEALERQIRKEQDKAFKEHQGYVSQVEDYINKLRRQRDKLTKRIETLDESIKELKSARSKDVKRARIDNKNLNKILDVATTFKQWGKGERNRSEFADPVIKGFVNELGKIKYRSDISRTKARKIVANLKPWYTEANLGDYFSQEIADRIDYIAERKDNTKYPDSEELQYIADVMQGIKHLYQTYDQMTLDGKKVSIRETATREYGVLENSPYSETRIRRLNWLSGRTGYGVKTTVTNAINNIIEPRVVYQMLEGFNEDGMLSKLFKATTDAETGMNAMYINMTRSFDDFFKDNKGYKKHYQKDMITVAGKQMTIGEAISLYWTANREEAKATLMSNRIGSGIVWQNANGVTQRIQNVADVEALRDSIWKQFSDEDKQLARMVHEFYTVTATDIKREADERILGFTNIREGRDDYYPFVRDKNQIGKKFADAKSLMSDVTSAYNYSFNKDIKQNVTLALQLIPADVMWKDHARKMSMYSNMTEILQTWDKVLNCNLAVDENGKKTGQESLRGKLSEKWKDFSKYHSNFMQDVQNKGRGEANPFANFVRGAYATSALGFNPKVIVSQFASYPTALMYLDEKSMTEGLGMKTDFDKLDEYSPYAMARAYENGIVLSEGNITSTLGEIGNKTTAGISWMDRQTIGKLWNACQVYVRDHNGYAIGTDENYRARAELHEQICRRTQPNYSQTERSGMMRSGNEIVKSFTMFTSVPLKQLSRMVETMTKASMAQEAYKRDASSENKAKLDQAKHEAVMCQVSCLLANAMYVALATLVRLALPKKDEDKELSVARFAKDTWDVYMGLVPVWKDLYGYFFNGYEINNYFYSQVNDMLNTVKKLGDFKDDPYGTMMDFTSQALMFSGIPVRNFKNVIKGVMNRAGDLVGGSAAYEIAKKQKSIANTSNKKYFLQYAYNALYDGDTQSASYIIQDMRSRGYTEKEIESALKSIFAQHAYDAWNSSDQAELTKVLNAMSILGWNESAISSQLKTLMKKGLQEESDIKAFARKLARYQRTGSGNADQLRTEMNRLIRKYTGQGYQQSIIEEAIQAAM